MFLFLRHSLSSETKSKKKKVSLSTSLKISDHASLTTKYKSMPEEEGQKPPLDAQAAAAGDERATRGVEAAANALPTRGGVKSDVNRGGGAGSGGGGSETSSPAPVAPATLVISGSSPSAGSTTVTAGLAAALRYGEQEGRG